MFGPRRVPYLTKLIRGYYRVVTVSVNLHISCQIAKRFVLGFIFSSVTSKSVQTSKCQIMIKLTEAIIKKVKTKPENN